MEHIINYKLTLLSEVILADFERFNCGNEALDHYLYASGYSDPDAVTYIVFAHTANEIISYFSLSCSAIYHQIGDSMRHYPAVEIKNFATNLKYQHIETENGISLSQSILEYIKYNEMVFYNLFLTSAETQNTEFYKAAIQDKNQFVDNGRLNMELLLERFVTHFNDLYGGSSEKFREEDERRYFLLYLKPIINGTGYYYIESRTRSMERTDVIVDYGGKRHVIELKIWRGNAYNQRGEQQLAGYLEQYHLKKGYMLSYNFNKNKETGLKRIALRDKVLIEAVV